MAKKTKKTTAKNGNGNGRPKARTESDARAQWVAEHYPNIAKAAGALVITMETMTPTDARYVSGFIRELSAKKCVERLGEHAAFRKQQKLDRLEAQESKHQAALAELKQLRAELA